MIGLFGGTFDPIHYGHLRPALEVFEILGLDELRLIPLREAVHREPPQTTPADRLAMVEAAVADQPGFVADPRELQRHGGSYTYDTLTSFRAEFGIERPLCLLLGEDAFRGFLSWRRSSEILTLAHLVVMARPIPGPRLNPALAALYTARRAMDPAALATRPAGRIYRHPVTQLAISSTAIRALVAAGRSPRYLVPDPVIAIIERKGLYRASEHPPRRLTAPRTTTEEIACSLSNSRPSSSTP
ncbi:nicotinate-nucleotide adenylyltransferase [Thioalkalicoccus limnaeus]|uniref:Probable nicotinate-nucleotide adenylyltransferase n=1 Tax=Thioalkalicoccus limnaeus TaxID=120681 RepID=A0ABV4B9B5_9GAMM